jgi:hypothetical protein
MPTRGRFRDHRGGGAAWRSPMTMLLGGALLSATSGCAGIDGSELAEFRPLPPDGFEMWATTTFFYHPGVYTWAENRRLRWIESYVHLNGLCPNGYQLSSRKVTFEFQSPLGYPVDEIVYRGHCTG